MATRKIAVIVGSLRRESFNRRVAEALIELAPSTLKLEIIEIGKLPLYNQDDDDNPPAESKAFKQRIKDADAVLFVTPEYNRSMPGVLKNAIDVASRPYGQSAWDGKPGAVISATPGGTGAFGANHHLRQSLVFLNVPCMQQPETYLAHINKNLGDDGKVNDPRTRELLEKFITAYAAWVDKILGEPAREAAPKPKAARTTPPSPSA